VVVLHRPELETRTDSFVLTTWLSASCAFVVYAKTNRRVRFEVRFLADEISRLCKGRTARTSEELREMVRKLKVAAVERFQTAMGEIDRLTPRRAAVTSGFQLAAEVAATLRQSANIATILELLRSKGGLAAPANSPLRQEAELLKRAGILRRRRRPSCVYVPTDAYVDAVASLGRVPG
jgi:hypothetical protein